MKRLSVFFISILLILVCALSLSAQQASVQANVLEEKGIISFHPIDIMLNPWALNRVWVDEPVPLSFYTAQEKDAQQAINEKNIDGITAFSPLGNQKEWIKIDFEEITPYTWKWVDFELIKVDGTLTKVNLLRPHWWIQELKADSAGNRVYLDMPELGAQGWAIVTAVRINQLDTRLWNENRKGDYVNRPITGKFEHESNDIYRLYFGDSHNPLPLSVTGSHPIWSVDKNDWACARDLQIGEKVKTQEGVNCLKRREKSTEKQKVYNLEVYKDHNFLVSVDKILVHNNCFEPVVLKNGQKGAKQINQEIKNIAAGGGTPQTDNVGQPAVFQNRRNTAIERKWEGAIEYGVDVPNMPNTYRILKKANGIDEAGNTTYKYGYSTDHYSTVHEFTPKDK